MSCIWTPWEEILLIPLSSCLVMQSVRAEFRLCVDISLSNQAPPPHRLVFRHHQHIFSSPLHSLPRNNNSWKRVLVRIGAWRKTRRGEIKSIRDSAYIWARAKASACVRLDVNVEFIGCRFCTDDKKEKHNFNLYIESTEPRGDNGNQGNGC